MAGVLALLAAPASAEIYKWTDEKGVVNYSNTPPTGRPAVQLEDETSRVSTIESGQPNDAAALRQLRERDLRQRVEQLERDAAASRQDQATEQLAYQQALQAARERCFAERRIDCDDPYRGVYEAPYGPVYAVPGVAVKPRLAAGSYRPTRRIAVGGGGVVGPYSRPPIGGIAAGSGPYGIGGGYGRAHPGGVVVGPGVGGIGAAYYPVVPEVPAAAFRPRPVQLR